MSPHVEGIPSSHGGPRRGSGRKPLVETLECRWIVSKIRETADCQDIVEMRMRYAVKQQNPRFIEAYEELDVEYQKLRSATFVQRQSWTANDVNSPVEEAREIRNQVGFQQWIHLPVPNQFIMNCIYKNVAELAAAHFSKPVSVRTVKACAKAWVQFEKKIHT